MQFDRVIKPGNVKYAVLDVEGLGLPDTNMYLYEFPLVMAYCRSKNKKEANEDPNASWVSIFGYVNEFFKDLTPEEQKCIAVTYACIHHDIDEFRMQKNLFKINELISTISAYIADLDKSINLIHKLHKFVISSDIIKIGMLENAGSRPQDSKELTFSDHEIMIIATLAVLCKILCPVFSLLISLLSQNLATRLQDLHCCSILTGIINAHNEETDPTMDIKSVTEKLKHYSEHLVTQLCRNDISSNVVAGYDVHSLAYSIYCKLLTHKLITISLTTSSTSTKNSNIMSFIVVFVRGCTKQEISSTKIKQPTLLREDREVESDDGNTARLETDSMVSKTTSDVVSLVTTFAKLAVERAMMVYDIKSDEITDCQMFYNTHQICPNTINTQLNSLMYGQDLDGSIGIKMLKINEFSMLTILTQLILAHHSETMDEETKNIFSTLIHLLTAVPSEGVVTPGLSGNNTWLPVSGSVYYRRCYERFQNATVLCKNKAWENHIRSIMDDTKTNHYVFNSAPYIYELLGQENQNGKVIPIDAQTFISYCYYYDWELGTRDEQRKIFQ